MTRHRFDVFKRQVSTRRVQRTWRMFAAQHKTTAQLVQGFVKCGIAGGRTTHAGFIADSGSHAGCWLSYGSTCSCRPMPVAVSGAYLD